MVATALTVETSFPTFISPDAFAETLLSGNLAESQLALMGAVFETGGLDQLSGVLAVLQNPQGIGGDISKEQFAAAVYQVVSRDSIRIQQLLMQARTTPPLPRSSVRFSQNPQEVLAAVFGAGRRGRAEARVGVVSPSMPKRAIPNSEGLRAQGAGTASSTAATNNETRQIEEAKQLITDGKIQDGVAKLIALAEAISVGTRRRAEDYSRIADLFVEAGLAMKMGKAQQVSRDTIYQWPVLFQWAAEFFSKANSNARDPNEQNTHFAKEIVATWFAGERSHAEAYLGILKRNVITRWDGNAPQVLQVLTRMLGYMLSVPPDDRYMLSVHPDFGHLYPEHNYRIAVMDLAETMPVSPQQEKLSKPIDERDTEKIREAVEEAKHVVVPGFVEGAEKLLGAALANAFLSEIMPAETLRASRKAAGTARSTFTAEIEANRKSALQLIERGDLAGGITILFAWAARAESAGKLEIAAELTLDQAFAIRKKGLRAHVDVRGTNYPYPGEGIHSLDAQGRFYAVASYYNNAAVAQIDLDRKVRFYIMVREACRLSGMSVPSHWDFSRAFALSSVSEKTRAVVREMASLTAHPRRRPSVPGFVEEVRRLLGPRLAETFLQDLMPQVEPATSPRFIAPSRIAVASTTPATADAQARKFVKDAVRAQKIKGPDLEKLAALLGPKVGRAVAVDDLRAEIRAGSGPLFDAFATLAGYTDANKQNLHAAIGHLIR
ncbi:MAG: hypothetical protein A3H42_00125 [Deltaproteobacteria bacterium RIFCSPLOWO2_02_FULL_46_8]|nr:MAG: hypothetical protein A3H42_00125 [Deltaproteobacteria bacterium RIFCSPLOWO2_02_FULL_46_8]